MACTIAFTSQLELRVVGILFGFRGLIRVLLFPQVQALLEAGADTVKAGPKGLQPVQVARENGWGKCVELLEAASQR